MKAFCSHCKELVPVRQGGINPRGDGRVRILYPLPHPDQDGRQCVGIHEDAGKAEFPEFDVAPGLPAPPDAPRGKGSA